MKSTRPRPEDKFKTAFKTSNEVEDRNQTCGRCGGKPLKRNECPAKDSIYNSCKRKGHWKKNCKTKTVSEIQSNQDDKEFFFGEIHIDQLDSVNQSTRFASSKLVKPELLIFRNVVHPSIDDHLNHPMI